MPRPTGAPAIAELNITPLIDVMLVLLIVFMAVVPVARRQLDTQLPAPPGGTQGVPPRAPVVRVDPKGLSLDARPVVSLDDLEARLRARLAGAQAPRVLVQAAGTLPYRDVVRVLDVARSAGAEQLAMLPALP